MLFSMSFGRKMGETGS